MVVFHDEKLDRLMDTAGNVRDYTLKELQKMKFRDWDYAGQEADGSKDGERMYIPALEEVLKLVKPYSVQKNVKINIELKNSVVRYQGMEEKVLALVEQYGMKEYIVYSSFNPESLRALKGLEPSAETGILQTEMAKCLELSRQCGADALHPHVDGVETAVSEDAPPDGHRTVRVWNGNEPFYKQARQRRIFRLAELQAKGVTDFITNVPEEYL